MATFTLPHGYSARPRLLRRADMVADSRSAPGADEEGSQRRLLTRLAGTNFRAGINILGARQWSPPHAYDAEHIIVLLSGAIDWTVEGTVYRLRRRQDMLFIPAGAEYSPRNPRDREASFLSILGRVASWPGRGVYRDGRTHVG